MRRLIALGAAAIASLVLTAPGASAALTIDSFGGGMFGADGKSLYQAGAHPQEVRTVFTYPLGPDGASFEDMKTSITEAPGGLIGNPEAVPTCPPDQSPNPSQVDVPVCPPSTQVGTADVRMAGGLWLGEAFGIPFPLYSVEPPTGSPARFVFAVMFPDVALDASLRPDMSGIDITVRSASQAISVTGIKVDFWGVPADPSHDFERQGGDCDGSPETRCVAGVERTPFLSAPTNCSRGAVQTHLLIESWQDQGVFTKRSFDADENGTPTEISGCELLDFKPDITVQPTTRQAETPTGLEVSLKVPQNADPDGLATAHLKQAKVTLPEGMTINPAVAEGLTVCTPAQYASETVDSKPGTGCPDGARIGSVAIDSPLLEDDLEGNLYIAQQDDPRTPARGAENPFDSLLAMYVVAKNRERGVMIHLSGQVEPDPRTGRLVTTFDDNPELPFNEFKLKFREGQRAPLVTPPTCGSYATEAGFVPWSVNDPRNPLPAEVVKDTSSFQITQGPGGGPCPAGGVPPFRPGLTAGTINNNAKSYSPFSLRLTRADGEQNMSRFSTVLPPGLLAKLAGVEKCSDAAIAAAKGKTGREELAAPSCPAGSQIGRVFAGAGVGSVLTYVPGKAYLAGPVGGAPLSVVVITPAVAGPFDLGGVVVREALQVDRRTAEVSVDGALSDPIPHILRGIPLKLRDLRVSIDRDGFTLNPTSCDPSSVKATLFGTFLDVFSAVDDVPTALSSRFQAANCASLDFKPKLSLRLKGGTKRGAYPALTAVVKAHPGDANIGRASVRMPSSAFLAQNHIKTVCTRVQFAAENCPKGSIYGTARAITPLLDEPLEGPVYLRSSSNPLPDMVVDLKGLVDIELAGRIDSKNGGIRTTFSSVPDAPVTRFVLKMQGGRKGLLQNSDNLCSSVNRAVVSMGAQSGKAYNTRPVVKPAGCKGKKGKRAKK